MALEAEFRSLRTRAIPRIERKIILLICAGAKDREIAKPLAINEPTVQSHISSIFYGLAKPGRGANIRVNGNGTSQQAANRISIPS
jgi:ATP/maltotriose-dependent transcriptional regulator MalT